MELVGDQLVTGKQAQDRRVEQMRGNGFGEVLSLAEGGARLSAFATSKPVEEWAGPVGSAKDIEAQFGIDWATLSTWYQNGAVIGLPLGRGTLGYPLEQFIDGHPLEELSDILAAAPDTRSAWLWLRQPHAALDGDAPLALLHLGKRDPVMDLAARDLIRESD